VGECSCRFNLCHPVRTSCYRTVPYTCPLPTMILNNCFPSSCKVLLPILKHEGEEHLRKVHVNAFLPKQKSCAKEPQVDGEFGEILILHSALCSSFHHGYNMPAPLGKTCLETRAQAGSSPPCRVDPTSHLSVALCSHPGTGPRRGRGTREADFGAAARRRGWRGRAS